MKDRKNLDINKLYDAVVIGGGPAGLTAALYLARARYRVLVVEKEHFGGQITITSEVVNYPGVKQTSGAALTETMRQQAQDFGAEFLLAEVTGLDVDGEIKTVHTSRGDIYGFGVLVATGAHPRMIGFEGEEEFRGHGVAYCATCDGEFFAGKEVFVVGGGFAAAEESVFLTKYAKHVTVLVRKSDFACAAAVAEETKKHEKISVLYNTEVESVSGDSALRKLRYKNNVTGETSEYHAADGDTFGVFVFAGYVPATSLLKGVAELDEQGYVITDSNQKTSIDGLYAAGDVCVKNLRQVVTAVGDGAIAATELERYAAAMQKKTGLHPSSPAAKAADPAKAQNAASGGAVDSGELFSDEIKAQLDTVFSRMARPLILKLYLDERPVSADLKGYMETMAARTDKLSVEIIKASSEQMTTDATMNSPAEPTIEHLPCVRVCDQQGQWTGLAFHGAPGGHEFTSFVLGLYNAAGPGQAIDEKDRGDIAQITEKKKLQVLISLSCTMCPELVTAAQRIAAENPHVSAEVYDINHFPELKDKYNVMSVPCLVIDEKDVSFGKKNLRQLLDIISK